MDRRAERTPLDHGNFKISENQPTTKPAIHFKVPALMIGSFITGTLFAVGQHLYFQSLNSKPVQGHQARDSRYSFAITFLLKTFLHTAISIACVQNIWRMLRSRSAKLETIDSVYGVLGSVLSLAKPRVWEFGPTVALLAVGVWVVIPLSAISPPSTLTVQTTAMNVSLPMKVPNLDFAIDNFALGGCDPALGAYGGPAPDLFRLVNSVATQGSVASLTAVAPCSNCIYTLDFYGPALQCINPNATISAQILNNTRFFAKEKDLDGPSYYTGFVPSYNDTDPTEGIPEGIKALYSNQATYGFLDYTSTDFAKIFLTYNNSDTAQQCGLYNASYQVEFNLTNGFQSTSVKNFTYLNGVVTTSDSTCANLDRYAATNVTERSAAGLRGFLEESAYQAIMQSLNTILIGHIDYSDYGGPVTSSTTVMSTILSTTPELTSILNNEDSNLADPRHPQSNSTSNLPLPRAIEELSKNITISLFSSNLYLQGADTLTSDWAPEALTNATDTSVQLFTQEQVYVYTPKLLFISWGVAILYSFFAVLLGLFSLIKNGQSYTNNFSTVFRATHHLDANGFLLPAETTGADPLPKRLANRTITLQLHPDSDGGSFEEIERYPS